MELVVSVFRDERGPAPSGEPAGGSELRRTLGLENPTSADAGAEEENCGHCCSAAALFGL